MQCKFATSASQQDQIYNERQMLSTKKAYNAHTSNSNKMENFVHLHVHTQYSILDGQAAIPKLVDKAVKNGMKGMAITDHGNMFGIKEFFNYCNKINKGKPKEEKFKPIFGCEVYCAQRDLHLKENNGIDKSGWHLILLAKNEQGYHNLIKIVSEAWVDGYYHRPRTDHKSLEKYHEGLIASSACLAGEIPRHISKGKIEEAENHQGRHLCL